MKKNKSRKRRNLFKSIIFTISLALCMVMMVSTTLAYLTDAEETVKNQFVPGEVEILVVEASSDAQSTDNKAYYTVTNNGNIDVYLRAKILINGESPTSNRDDNRVSWKTATASTINEDSTTATYFEKDGFYYFTNRLEQLESTMLTIEWSEPSPAEGQSATGTAENTETPKIEVLVQGIQADGGIYIDQTNETDSAIIATDAQNEENTGSAEPVKTFIPAVTDAWNIKVENDVLVDPSHTTENSNAN